MHFTLHQSDWEPLLVRPAADTPLLEELWNIQEGSVAWATLRSLCSRAC